MPNISTQERTIRELQSQAESFRQNAIAIERTIEIMKAGTPTVEAAPAPSARKAAPTKSRRRTARRERIAAPTTGKRKPGRPKGSRNKPKGPGVTEVAASTPAAENTDTPNATSTNEETWAGTP